MDEPEVYAEEEMEEQEAGKRRVKKLHDPLMPTEREVQEHYLAGHLPYRSWCHHCVRGRGRELNHVKRGDKEQRGIPEYPILITVSRAMNMESGLQFWLRSSATPR